MSHHISTDSVPRERGSGKETNVMPQYVDIVHDHIRYVITRKSGVPNEKKHNGLIGEIRVQQQPFRKLI